MNIVKERRKVGMKRKEKNKMMARVEEGKYKNGMKVEG